MWSVVALAWQLPRHMASAKQPATETVVSVGMSHSGVCLGTLDLLRLAALRLIACSTAVMTVVFEQGEIPSSSGF